MEPSKRLIATPTRTAEIMKQHDIVMKKSLGQNFLIEPTILDKMIDSAQITKETTVIEIGPGIGALTEFLAMSAKQVLAFEIDPRFINILEDTLSEYENVKVIHNDILKVNFNDEAYQFLKDSSDLVVVANLPYYITTPIIMHLLSSDLPFNRLIMMMQKEVAERMTAEVGTKAYNSLTIAIQNKMVADVSFIVPKNVFIPKPNVDSAVLTLVRRDKPLVEVEDFRDFENFVQLSFTQRRKTLWNNLRNYYNNDDIDLDKLEQVFNESEIDPKRRAETLTIYEFKKLYEKILEI
ncbi:16S rRNA (adenine(1518)-N(6)/adenine(1519)-N(6))-dimethyltransferase RsmA [Aerococcaceae bacterium WGS1372]